jgi:hypothetical protein
LISEQNKRREEGFAMDYENRNNNEKRKVVEEGRLDFTHGKAEALSHKVTCMIST